MATPLLPAGGEATQVISRPQPTSVLPPQERDPGTPRKAWVGALLAIVVMALLAAGAYLLVTMLTDDGAGDLVAVPELVGLPEEEALDLLEAEGLELGERKIRRTDEVPPGEVVEQNPLPLRQVPTGSRVDIWVSAPPRLFVVPSVVGGTLEDAEGELATANLVLGDVTEQNDPDIPEGRIISQDPPAGEEVPRETPVNVVVSAGPSVVIVPDVTCRTYASAKAELEGLGLVAELGDPVLPRPECPNPVNVAQQDTPPGTQVEPGTVIVLHQGMLTSPSPTESPSP
jgi:serine/threonine-protein kinase